MMSLLKGLEADSSAAANPPPTLAGSPARPTSDRGSKSHPPARKKIAKTDDGAKTPWFDLRHPSVELIGVCAILFVTLLALLFGNVITKFFFIILAVITINGYGLGGSKVAAALGGLLIAPLLGVPLGRLLESLFSGVLGTTGLTNRVISILIMGTVVLILVSTGLQFVVRSVVKQNPHWKRHDRLAGAGLGLVEGVLLGLVMIWTVLALAPIAETSVAQFEERGEPPNQLATAIANLADSAQGSAIGNLAASMNPLDNRLIELLHKGLVMLNHPEARKAFLQHPAIEAIQHRPAVEDALSRFASDAEIMAIVESEDGITGAGMRTILDSPTLLGILDETTVLEELSPIADDIEQAINDALVTAGLDKEGQQGELVQEETNR